VPVCDELGRASWVRGEHACGHARATGTSQLLSITRRETTHDVSGRTRGRTTLSRRGHVWSQLGEHTPVLSPSSSERENCDSDAGDARNRSGRRGAQGEPVTRLCSTPLNLSRCQNSASSAFRLARRSVGKKKSQTRELIGSFHTWDRPTKRHFLTTQGPGVRNRPIPLYESTNSVVYNSRTEMAVTLRALRQ
jgi:hypothetical protein